MRLEIKDLVNKHKNQKCLVVGHGPSLKCYRNKLQQLKDDGFVLLGCNEWPSFHLSCSPHYWILANNIQTTKTSLADINEYKPIWIYADTVDLVNYSFLEKNVKTDWLPYGHANANVWTPYNHPRHIINKDRLTIQEELQKYTKYDKKYGTGSTVALHMVSFAILMGFAEINLIGLDFDYHIKKGYVENPSNLRPSEPNHFDIYGEEILNDMQIIADSAKNLENTKIYNLNKDSHWKIFDYKEL